MNLLPIFKAVPVLLLIALCPLNVSASSSITIDFSGSLTDSFGSLNAGDAFSGSYTFDATVAADAGSTSSFASFNNLLSANLQIGGFSATLGPGTGLPGIQQDDVANADRYAVLALNPTANEQIGGLAVTAFGFRLDDSTGNAVTDALNLITPSLANFSSNGFLIFLDSPLSPNFHVVNGVLSSLDVRPAAVPLPAAAWLMVSALMGFLLAQKRRLA